MVATGHPARPSCAPPTDRDHLRGRRTAHTRPWADTPESLFDGRSYDPHRIIECETGAEALQWEAAERIYTGTQVGKTVREIAEEIGKGIAHVSYMSKVWRVHLGEQPEDRPPFNEAYQAAKKPKGDGSDDDAKKPKPQPPEPEPDYRPEGETEEETAAFINATNSIGHNLSKSQRAFVALEQLPFFEKLAAERMKAGKANPTEQVPGGTGEAREVAARQVGVSGKYVSTAKRIRRDAQPLEAQVMAGDLSLSAADKKVAEEIENRKVREF